MMRTAILLTLPFLLIQPSPDFEVLDRAAFEKLFPKGAAVRKLAGELQFGDGPVWVTEPGGGYLVFSDIEADELKRWDAKGGVRTFRSPSGSANGNTLAERALPVTRRINAVRGDITARKSLYAVDTLVRDASAK